MSAEARLPGFAPPLIESEIPDLGDLHIEPRSSSSCWRGYNRESLKHVGRNHPVLVRRLVELFSRPGDTIGDPLAGIGTVLVEGARLGRSGWGCEFDARYGILACRNVELVDGATVRLEVGKDARSELKYVGGLACIITSPPYPNAHDAGSSEKQEVLRQKAKLHAGQGYRIAPGHLLHGNWRTNFIELWQACRPALAYNGVLCVITKDWVEEDQRFDFTRIVAEGIRDAGYELVGRHWRVVDRVGFHTFGHRTQYRKKTGRVPLFIDHEDVIIARSAE